MSNLFSSAIKSVNELDNAIESIRKISLRQSEETESLLALISVCAEQTTYQVSDLLGGFSAWLQKQDYKTSEANTLIDLWKLYLDNVNKNPFKKGEHNA